MKLIQKENKNYYQCEECQHIYEIEEWAKKCEEWCKEHKSCNLEITKYAVKTQNYAELTQNSQKNTELTQNLKKNKQNNTELTQNSQKNSASSASNSASSASVQHSSAPNSASSVIKNLLQIIIGILIGGLAIFALTNFKLPKITQNLQNNAELTQNLQNNSTQAPNISNNDQLIQRIIAQVLPQEGFKTRLVFGDAVKKMIDCGVIDLEKMKKLYNGNIPEYIRRLVANDTQIYADNKNTQINAENYPRRSAYELYSRESAYNDYTQEPIVINQETANYLLNLFWPLGLSNKTEFNKNIPFSEKELPYLASTGGWWLGKADNGAEYFNKCEIIKLTKEQEEIVYRVAQNTFRPCCNNSTFAQDCNHGSALLGALELAASQGYNEDELYKLTLQLNSFWFPQNYIKIALYKKLVEGKDWPLNQNYAELTQNLQNNVEKTELTQNSQKNSESSTSSASVKRDSISSSASSASVQQNSALIKEIMSAKFSSISGYIQNVEKKLANIPNIPSTGGGCGL